MIVGNKLELITSFMDKNSNQMQPECLAMGNWIRTVGRKLCYGRNLRVDKINMIAAVTHVGCFGILRFLNFLQWTCIVLMSWRDILSQITWCKLRYEASRTSVSRFKTRTWEQSYGKVYRPWVKLLMVLLFTMFQPFVNLVQKTRV